MVQAIIFLSGALAIWFSQSANAVLVPWACIVGLIGQPFWFLSTRRNRQWGIFLLTVIYTGAWLFGLWNHWIKAWVTA